MATPQAHHKQGQVALDRPKYRAGRKDRAVKVYTVNDESRYLLVQNVPAYGARKELLELFSVYGEIEEYRMLDDYPAEEYTEVYWVRMKQLAAARLAKRKLDDHRFFGNGLHVAYAPEFESVEDTRQKLRERRNTVNRKTQQGGQISQSGAPPNGKADARSIPEDTHPPPVPPPHPPTPPPQQTGPNFPQPPPGFPPGAYPPPSPTPFPPPPMGYPNAEHHHPNFPNFPNFPGYPPGMHVPPPFPGGMNNGQNLGSFNGGGPYGSQQTYTNQMLPPVPNLPPPTRPPFLPPPPGPPPPIPTHYATQSQPGNTAAKRPADQEPVVGPVPKPKERRRI
eukprot:comp10151_c0_seq1/m.4990 comp10151_c0_seq1/g.4990  ORF comp10151_c0_seq1/g.4990 comp10151_c0_seq1/m.4990 type:complete len:336 (-) comp10151_c0_seq1:33-1040(-)